MNNELWLWTMREKCLTSSYVMFEDQGLIMTYHISSVYCNEKMSCRYIYKEWNFQQRKVFQSKENRPLSSSGSLAKKSDRS